MWRALSASPCLGVRGALETALVEARGWRAAVGGGPDPQLGKRLRD